LQLHLTDHLNITMKFIILASLFVLSVVAEPEAQHFTAGFVQHHNGAVVPQDTDSVKVAKVQHLAAKNTAYLNAGKHFYGHFPTYKVQTPVAYKVQTPLTYKVQTPAHTYPINPFYHVYQPHVYTHVPTVHHMAKREAEAEPEADAQYLQYYNRGYGYTPYTTGYQTYGYTGYPYTTGYTYSPYFNNFYNRRVFKREAEAEAEPEADAQFYYNTHYNTYQQYPYSAYSAYTGYPTTYNTYTYSPYTYNPYHFAQRRFVREAEAEPEAEADAQYYYNTGYYGNYQSGFRYPYTSYARTPYTYNTYSPYNYNTFNGYYRY